MPLYIPRKWIERYTETVHWKSLDMKHNFMHSPIEICSSTSNSLIIIGNFWKHLTLIHIKASFFVLYTVIPGYEFIYIYEIMKWNISKIKHHNYEVLNLQVYLIVLMLTHGNLSFWGIFCRANVIFITGMPFFLLLPHENEFLQIFWTINAHSNEEFTMKHWEKTCEVCGRFFWSFLHQYHLAIW